MTIEINVYKVDLVIEREYHPTIKEWSKYFSGKDEQTVLDYVYSQCGRPRYCNWRRESTNYTITKLYIEEAKSVESADG